MAQFGGGGGKGTLGSNCMAFSRVRGPKGHFMEWDLELPKNAHHSSKREESLFNFAFHLHPAPLRGLTDFFYPISLPYPSHPQRLPGNLEENLRK